MNPFMFHVLKMAQNKRGEIDCAQTLNGQQRLQLVIQPCMYLVWGISKLISFASKWVESQRLQNRLHKINIKQQNCSLFLVYVRVSACRRVCHDKENKCSTIQYIACWPCVSDRFDCKLCAEMLQCRNAIRDRYMYLITDTYEQYMLTWFMYMVALSSMLRLKWQGDG